MNFGVNKECAGLRTCDCPTRTLEWDDSEQGDELIGGGGWGEAVRSSPTEPIDGTAAVEA